MKSAVATLAILTAGALSLAFADPPANPVVPESRSATTQNSPAEDSTSQSSAARAVPATAAVTAGKSPVVAPAQPGPSTSAQEVQERLLRNQGYKLMMVRGEEKYCRRETPLGSHLATVMHCVTVAEAEAMAREGRETAERLQRNTAGCLSKSQGGCGQ